MKAARYPAGPHRSAPLLHTLPHDEQPATITEMLTQIPIERQRVIVHDRGIWQIHHCSAFVIPARAQIVILPCCTPEARAESIQVTKRLRRQSQVAGAEEEHTT